MRTSPLRRSGKFAPRSGDLADRRVATRQMRRPRDPPYTSAKAGATLTLQPPASGPYRWPRRPILSGVAFALPQSYAVRLARAELVANGGRHLTVPHYPSWLVSKHKRIRKKSLICSICSGPPRYYNLLSCSRAPLIPLQGSAARLFSCVRPGSVASGAGVCRIVYRRGKGGMGGCS